MIFTWVYGIVDVEGGAYAGIGEALTGFHFGTCICGKCDSSAEGREAHDGEGGESEAHICWIWLDDGALSCGACSCWDGCALGW